MRTISNQFSRIWSVCMSEAKTGVPKTNMGSRPNAVMEELQIVIGIKRHRRSVNPELDEDDVLARRRRGAVHHDQSSS